MGGTLSELGATAQGRVLKYITVGTQGEQVLPADPRRWSLRFFTNALGLNVFPSADPFSVGNIGFGIDTSKGSDLIKYPDYLMLVQFGWYVGANPGGSIIWILESFIKERG